MVSLTSLGISASTESGIEERSGAVVMGVAVAAEAVSLAEFATSSSDVASNTLVISVSVEEGTVDAVIGVGDESVALVGVLELSILWVESVIDNAVVLLTGVTVTIVVVAETGRIIDVVLALSLVGRLVVGVGGVLTLIDIIDDLVVLLTVVFSLIAVVLGSGIIDVVSALDVVTLVATVLIGALIVESSEGITSLESEVEAASVAEAVEAANALESSESAETVLVSLAAPSLAGTPAVGAPTALGTPVVDIGVTISVVSISATDTVLVRKVVVLGGSNMSVVVAVTAGLTAEVETSEVTGLVLATGALAVAVVNGFGVATTSSKAVVATRDALRVDFVWLTRVRDTLATETLTRVTADGKSLAERASGSSAGGGLGAVDVSSAELAVATAETVLTTLTRVTADGRSSAERARGSSAGGGLGAVDVSTERAAEASVATIGGSIALLTTPGGSSDSSKSAESERLEHFVCRDYDKLFKSLAFKCFRQQIKSLSHNNLTFPNSTNLQNVVRNQLY